MSDYISHEDVFKSALKRHGNLGGSEDGGGEARGGARELEPPKSSPSSSAGADGYVDTQMDDGWSLHEIEPTLDSSDGFTPISDGFTPIMEAEKLSAVDGMRDVDDDAMGSLATDRKKPEIRRKKSMLEKFKGKFSGGE